MSLRWQGITDWQRKKKKNTSQDQNEKANEYSELVIYVCDVSASWTSSLRWVQSVPGFSGSLGSGLASGPLVKHRFSLLCQPHTEPRRGLTYTKECLDGSVTPPHTLLVCLFDSATVIWHLNWVREVLVVLGGRTVDTEAARRRGNAGGTVKLLWIQEGLSRNRLNCRGTTNVHNVVVVTRSVCIPTRVAKGNQTAQRLGWTPYEYLMPFVY